MRVLVCGDLGHNQLGAAGEERIRHLMTIGATVLLNNGGGVARLAQQMLKDAGYAKVVVYEIAGGRRGNLGNWPSVTAATEDERDRLMRENAHYAVAIIDPRLRWRMGDAEADAHIAHKPNWARVVHVCKDHGQHPDECECYPGELDTESGLAYRISIGEISPCGNYYL